MKIIKPYYQILSKIESKEMLKSIERAGRTAYKSEDQITDESAERFIKMIIERGHESVLEHEKISILFVCDRGVSHEIVRHRIASFSQESTRYCNYNKDKFNNELTFIIPLWCTLQPSHWSLEQVDKSVPLSFTVMDLVWLRSMAFSEIFYIDLINAGWQPQQARSVLPNSLKTEIVVTANIREWRTIFKLRTAMAAHPQMRELMCPLLNELKQTIPVVFNDITY
jgi:thymidylate synthase (FAD)